MTVREEHARRALGFVLVAVAAAHLVHLAATLATPGLVDLFILDSRVYDDMASRFASEGFFAGNEAFGHAPLYPLWLSALRRLGLDGAGFAIACQVALGIANAGLVGCIGMRSLGPRAAAPAAALYGFYGAGAMLETKLMPSTLGVFLVLASLLALIEANRRGAFVALSVAGLLLGAACLVRPNTLLFAPLAAGWIVWRAWADGATRPLARASIFALGVVLAVAPVTLRNHEIEGEWILVTAHGGMTFYQSNNEAATGTYSRIPGAVGNPRQLAERLREVAERERGQSLRMSEVDGYWRDRALAFLAEDPVRAAALVSRKLRFWLGNDEVSTEYVLATEREITPTLWLLPVPFALILGLSLVGAQAAWASGRFAADAWLCVGFVATNLATIGLFYFSSRYRLPAVPLLCVFGGAGVVALWDRARARDFGRGGWLLAGLALGLFSAYPFSDDYARYASHQWFNYGIVQDERGEIAASIESFERARDGMNDQWHLHYALGRAYGKADRPEDALRAYKRAIELRPQSLDIRRGIEAQRARLAERERT